MAFLIVLRISVLELPKRGNRYENVWLNTYSTGDNGGGW